MCQLKRLLLTITLRGVLEEGECSADDGRGGIGGGVSGGGVDRSCVGVGGGSSCNSMSILFCC